VGVEYLLYATSNVRYDHFSVNPQKTSDQRQ
jgi:hypothetical protein